MKKRIDSLLVDRKLVESRNKAQAVIMAGEVTVDGRAVIKPGGGKGQGCFWSPAAIGAAIWFAVILAGGVETDVVHQGVALALIVVQRHGVAA